MNITKIFGLDKAALLLSRVVRRAYDFVYDKYEYILYLIIRIKSRIRYYIKSCHNHEFREYTGPFDIKLRFCKKCGYNDQLGFFAEKFINKS